MSIPSGVSLTDSQEIPVPEPETKGSDLNGSHDDALSKETNSLRIKYTTLLEKHLSLVESEQSRRKGQSSTKPDLINNNDVAPISRASGNDKQVPVQETRIHRVPHSEWREVKKEPGINAELPILIASSRGQGRAGRPTAGQSITRHVDTSGNDVSYQKGESSFDTVHRLAINSRMLLNLLRDCTGIDFPEDRNVWLRPFKYLVVYEMEIRKAMQNAEAAFDQTEADSRRSMELDTVQNHTECGTLTTNAIQGKGESPDGAENLRPVSTAALSRAKAERDQLHCLVDFMNSDMQDIFDIKRQVVSRTIKDIAFEHLWLLYKPGDLVYTFESRDDHGTYQAYRILHVTGGRPTLNTIKGSEFDPVYHRDWDDESDSEEKACDTIRSSPSNITPFIIDCFSIDFDGNILGPKSRRFVIPTYTGKRSINALDICLSIFHPQYEQVYGELVRRGRRFTQLADPTHKRYSGMTLRQSRDIWDSRSSGSNYVIHEEEVQGEVMLDQSAGVTHYRKTLQDWRLKIGGRLIGAPTSADQREVSDPFPLKRIRDESTDVFDDSTIDLDRRSDYVSSTTLLQHYRNIRDLSLSDDLVVLLPFRIYGFVMLSRKWFPLNINLTSDINPDEVQMTAAGLEDLVLPDGHKKLLQAIVKNQVRDEPNEFQMDVVKGKGRGLIILLHGAPGVGKTSTAECVAAQLKRPLLPITCGDISTNVKEAEATLQEFCRLADRWRCVLLLDEADVFLAKREKGDITRNGLVSVFLRVLEYFSGVIILTTNRVGEFDEAFRSRIHVSLYYPKLHRDATLQIWDRNLLRLRNSGVDFAEDEIRKFAQQHWLDNVENASRHWNGRQIKNAFQTAIALANWEYYETKQGQSLERPLLKAKHFDRVAKTSAHFDDYISHIYNISEDTYGVLAARSEIRNDTHPAMSLGRPDAQDFVPRSRRAAPARRGAGTRGARAEESTSGGNDATVRELELKLELMKLKKAKGKAETQTQTQAGDNDDEEEEW